MEEEELGVLDDAAQEKESTMRTMMNWRELVVQSAGSWVAEEEVVGASHGETVADLPSDDPLDVR